ncbi:MAG: LemA family protein [Proteobacteria bacterium]|nr:LemA family protein [Pseudomonadota bacterium]
MFTTAILLAIVFGCVIWVYNRLIHDRNQVRAAWSDIDVQLKRRYDLIPQLIATVQAYADYEKATMVAVTDLRIRAAAAGHLPDKALLEADLARRIDQLIVVAEAYPDLKADQNFQQLQRDLVDVEDHLQYSRRFYNGAVRILNTRIESFPHLLIARPFGFKPAEFFEVGDASERAAPLMEPGGE